MNKTNLQLRTVLIKMYKLKKKAPEISEVTGIKIRTVYSYIKILKDAENRENKEDGEDGEAKVLSDPPKITRQTKLDLVKFKQYILDNPFKFHREIGEVFGIKKSAVGRWKIRLGFKRKKAKTTYKESDLELKKTSLKN